MKKMKVLLLAITVTLINISSAVILKTSSSGDVIPGKYIVKLKDDIKCKKFIINKSLKTKDGVFVNLKKTVSHVYDTAFNGFATKLDDSQLQALNNMTEVCYLK